MEDIKGKELIDDTPIENVDNNNNKVSDDLESNKQPTAESEENAMKKKYGGLLPKKIPLISKVNGMVSNDICDQTIWDWHWN
ncbi:unnamed protein product [Cochlearia groenlandica]